MEQETAEVIVSLVLAGLVILGVGLGILGKCLNSKDRS